MTNYDREVMRRLEAEGFVGVDVQVTGEDPEAVANTKAIIARALSAAGARRVPERRRLRVVGEDSR